MRSTRRFHRPTGLDAKSRVWLVVEGVQGEAEVGLNGRVLEEVAASNAAEEVGGTRLAQFEITQLLRPENEIAIVVCSALPGGGSQTHGFGSVRLEIDQSDA